MMPESARIEDDISKLNEILSKNVVMLHGVRSDSKNIELELEETHTSVPYSVVLKKVPADYLLLKFDTTQCDLFTEELGASKCADYCLITRTADSREKWIVFIELKTCGGSKDAVQKQLKGAKCRIGYCKLVMKEFKNSKLLEGYQERYVCIQKIKKTTNKRSTKYLIDNSSPDKFLRIEGMEEIMFDRCLQRRSNR